MKYKALVEITIKGNHILEPFHPISEGDEFEVIRVIHFMGDQTYMETDRGLLPMDCLTFCEKVD